MDNLGPTHRSDEQLLLVLHETGRWAVKGQSGQVLGFAISLGHALERAAAFGGSGAPIIAICRLPFDNIVVFPEQLSRLEKIVAGRELAPLQMKPDPTVRLKLPLSDDRITPTHPPPSA